MCLVALQDPGLTVFPTHRLVRGLSAGRDERLRSAIERDFDAEVLAVTDDLTPRSRMTAFPATRSGSATSTRPLEGSDDAPG